MIKVTFLTFPISVHKKITEEIIELKSPLNSSFKYFTDQFFQDVAKFANI